MTNALGLGGLGGGILGQGHAGVYGADFASEGGEVIKALLVGGFDAGAALGQVGEVLGRGNGGGRRGTGDGRLGTDGLGEGFGNQLNGAGVGDGGMILVLAASPDTPLRLAAGAVAVHPHGRMTKAAFEQAGELVILWPAVGIAPPV